MKEKILCGGKLVFTDFSNLNPDDFHTSAKTMEEMKAQSAAVRFDGRLYINSSAWNGKDLCSAFSKLVVMNRRDLNYVKKIYRRKYPKIKNLEDYEKMEGTEAEKEDALVLYLVYIEEIRRKVEKDYF